MDAMEMRQATEETLLPADSFGDLFEEHYESVLRALYLLTGHIERAFASLRSVDADLLGVGDTLVEIAEGLADIEVRA